jgi:hypothetical protein
VRWSNEPTSPRVEAAVRHTEFTQPAATACWASGPSSKPSWSPVVGSLGGGSSCGSWPVSKLRTWLASKTGRRRK